MPKMPKYRDGGAFRGCGAQVKGKKFKGILVEITPFYLNGEPQELW